ncbi:MAG: hypothetical protein IJR14_04790 [Synergistaceae bacterium]|nr:hypothetical protein [Synergistaceae bacterium]
MNDAEERLADPRTVRDLIENQRRELALKEKELDLEKAKIQAAQKADERQLAYARQQLEATERDRRDAREYDKTVDLKAVALYIVLIISLLLFLIVAIWKDKDDLVIEIVKTVTYGGSFGVGGYAWGRYRQSKEKDDGER